MNRYYTFYLLGLGLTGCQFSPPTLFSLIPASESGITFANRIPETDSLNILDYQYIYNGGGVGLSDFNNDGLTDVFFSGNAVGNKLYLNKGNFKFEDVAKQAGVISKQKWNQGVAVVDINNDGRPDIYVTATYHKDPALRANSLFVNQGLKNGVPIFRDMAAEYGIADTTHSTNAAFFDYDNDGDLDLYVLVDTPERFPNVYRNKILDGSSPNTDRLYRNDFDARLGHAVFTDVSKQAGILIEGYGLGLNITDINRDGWKDIYVTNDYVTNDNLFINNHKGGFTDQARQTFKHTSNSAMGNDVADLNNDGLMDIVALDMMPRNNIRKKMLMGPNNYQFYLNNEAYGSAYEYTRNTMQLNQGLAPRPLNDGLTRPTAPLPIFSEISLLADMAETDWSWTPLVTDFDNDGFRDLLITNGFPKDVTDRDFMAFRSENEFVAGRAFTLNQIPVVRISNYAFHNNGAGGSAPPTFTDVTKDWGINHPSFSNGAAYGDLDNDGDLDYVVNNINDSAFVYRNNLNESRPEQANYLRVNFTGPAQNRAGLGAIVELYYKTKNGPAQQVYEHSPYRGYLSTVEPTAHFGLGSVATVDEVRIIWPGLNGQPQHRQTLRHVKANQVLSVDVRNAREPVVTPGTVIPAIQGQFTDVTDSLGIKLVHQEPEYIDFNNQKLLPHKLSQFGPAVSTGDVNGDRLADIFVAGSREHKGRFLMQTPGGQFTEKDALPGAEGAAKTQEDMGTLLFDAEGDGDLDLYIASGSAEGPANTPVYQDRLYVNDGKGQYTLSATALPVNTTSKSCVKAIDFDRDGDLDLFVGGRVEPDKYPKPVSSFILRNESAGGQPKFTDVTAQVAPQLNHIGLVCDALWTDPDNDGWPDLMLAGEWMPLTLLKNEQGKRFSPVADASFGKAKGWWNSLVAGDFDHDGDTDYIAGNLGLNARMRASEREPVRIYAGDFDSNGFYDAIPTIFIPDETGERREYSFHGRDDLIKQMIVMRKRFPYFKDFTQASIDKLLTPEERKNALVLEANYMQSVYVENTGNGSFTLHPLPMQAQLAPIFGMVADDVDRDGNLDVMLVGNDFSAELLMGRYDALNGLWLKGDGKGGFAPQTIANSGFYVPGNAKGLAQLADARGRKLLVATQNRGRLCVFRNQHPEQAIHLQTLDAVALLTNTQGKTERVECSYGSSYLSQSDRTLRVGPTVKRVEIIDSKGKKRVVMPETKTVANR